MFYFFDAKTVGEFPTVNQKFYKKATKQRGPGDTYKEREREGGRGQGLYRLYIITTAQ